MQAMRFLLSVALASGACAPESSVETSYLYTPPGQDEQCGPNGCGGNSPVIAGVYFYQLHVGGLENDQDVQIIGARRADGLPMKLRLSPELDRLVGVDVSGTGTIVAQYSMLENARIKLLVKGVPYELTLRNVHLTESFWVTPGGALEKYDIFYRPLSNGGEPVLDPSGEPIPEKPLCSESDGIDDMVTALVFGGDLYDPDTKMITTGAVTNGWFNIACKNSAPYKMQKFAYTDSGQLRLGIVTTPNHRRALLNAWTSNVCGNGTAFTFEGEPITLRESLGVQLPTSPYLAAASVREAIWDEHGAVCLNVHRLHEDDPDIYDKIEEECERPQRCYGMVNPWLHGLVVTGSP